MKTVTVKPNNGSSEDTQIMSESEYLEFVTMMNDTYGDGEWEGDYDITENIDHQRNVEAD